MRIWSLSYCDLESGHKFKLLQHRTSEREAGAGAEREDTDALATTIVAGVVRGGTRDGHVQEMATRTDDTDTDEMIATATTTVTAIVNTVRLQMKQSAESTTVDENAQGQDLESIEDTEVARRGTGETEKETATDTDMMIEARHRHRHSDLITKRRGHEQS